MSNRRRLQNRLAALLKHYDAEIQTAFLKAVRGKVNSIDLRELANAIEARDFNRALNIAGLTRADLFPFDTSITSAYVAGGQTVPAAAPSFAAAFGFDGRATRAEAWAREHVGGLVTNIVADQLDMLRDVITDQLAQGINPRQIASRISGAKVGNKRVGGFIGLSNPQKDYLRNAIDDLDMLNERYFTRKLRDRRFDGIVRKAIDTKTPLSNRDIARIADAYSERMKFHRAEVIARTESITALRAGRREGIQQGIEAGAIKQDRIKRVWSATLDARTRPDHVIMDGQEVEGMDTPFTLPDGSKMLYPGDSSLGAPADQVALCRCYDEYVVDFLRP